MKIFRISNNITCNVTSSDFIIRRTSHNGLHVPQSVATEGNFCGYALSNNKAISNWDMLEHKDWVSDDI
jgi:hypothetical protein